MMEWFGLQHDVAPTPPPRPTGFRFFLHGCILGIALGMLTLCVMEFAVLRALAGQP